MGIAHDMSAPLPRDVAAPPVREPAAARAALLAWPPPAWLGLAAFAAVAALLLLRVLGAPLLAGEARIDSSGLIDFRDAVYYPTRAFVDGYNPYDIATYAARYPVGWPFPLYSPIALVLYSPLALAALPVAALLFVALNILLVPAASYLALRLNRLAAPAGAVFGLAALGLLTRGSYVTLSIGQSTIYVTLALYTALYLARRRPWLAGAALAVASLKPTFAVPVACLMLARGDGPAVWRGALLAALGGVLPLAWLAAVSGGAAELSAILLENNRYMRALGDVHAALAPLRVDAIAVLSRLYPPAAVPLSETMLTAGIIAAGALLVRRLRDNPAAEPLVLLLIVCTALLCTYHQVYDVFMLLAPAAGLLLSDWVTPLGGSRRLRWLLLALLATPLCNYAMSRGVMNWLDRPGGVAPLVDAPVWLLALASLSGVALLAAFAVSARLALRVERHA